MNTDLTALLHVMIQIQLTKSRIPDIWTVGDVIDVLNQIRTVVKMAFPGMIKKMINSPI